MTTTPRHIAELILKEQAGSLHAEDRVLLDEWLNASPEHSGWYQSIIQSKELIKELYAYGRADGLAATFTVPDILGKANENIVSDISGERNESHVIKTSPIILQWTKYAAAIILFIGIGAYLWSHFHSAPEKPAIAVLTPSSHDISPGSNKAILTLSNGEKIELSSTASETIIDGSLPIANREGQLNYLNSSRGSNPLRGGASERSEEGVGVTPSATNTMTTPKGGQYALTLSDGTKVWLNAASSITYPVVFTSKTREVKITGEAYFEVTTDKEKPFIVRTACSPFEKGGHDAAPETSRAGDFPIPEMSIIVLGTSFNINTYPDEPFAKTSLISGSVKIQLNDIKASSNEVFLLKPGQAFSNGKITTTNIEKDLAWKNGYFNFEGADLAMVMRQLSRWYDIDIEYPNHIPHVKFVGELSRKLTLKQVLNILKDVDIQFELRGKTLLVK